MPYISYNGKYVNAERKSENLVIWAIYTPKIGNGGN